MPKPSKSTVAPKQSTVTTVKNDPEWLTLKHIVVPAGGVFVIQGGVLDEQDRSLWHFVTEQFVEAGNIVQAGSRFRAKLARGREVIWLRDSVVTSTEVQRHFNLEDVFADQVDANPLLGGRQSLASILRAHEIYSLEDVLLNVEGSIPYSESTNNQHKSVPITAQAVLRSLVDEAALNDLLARCREIVE